MSIYNKSYKKYLYKQIITNTAISTISISFMINCSQSYATTYNLPKYSDVIGENIVVKSGGSKQDYLRLSEKYKVGYHEINEANSNANLGFNEVLIPTKFILPKNLDGKHEGVVVNLAELRLYYYDTANNKVHTYPIGIGRSGWQTPVSKTSIISKQKDPTWTVPKSIKEEVEARGGYIEDKVPPGPDNPLGQYALRLGLGGYLIHGTNSKVGVGLRVSHGCMRMFNDDIKDLFYKVPEGTSVHIINQPYKVGRNGNKLYLEAHQPLSGYDGGEYSEAVIENQADKYGKVKINWVATEEAADDFRGIPVPIGNI